MKKILAIVLAAIMVLSLAACGGSSAPAAAPAAEAKAEEAAPAAEAKGDVPVIAYVPKVRNLGRKSLEEVLAKLKDLGLQLNQGEE